MTDREIKPEYIVLFQSGLSNEEIAKRTRLKKSTVVSYRSILARKGKISAPTRAKRAVKKKLNQRVLRDGKVTLEEASDILKVSVSYVRSQRILLKEAGVFVSTPSRVSSGRFFHANNFLTLHMCPECDADLVRDGYANGAQRFLCPECGKKLSATAVLDDIAAQLGFENWRALSVAIAHGEAFVSVLSPSSQQDD